MTLPKGWKIKEKEQERAAGLLKEGDSLFESQKYREAAKMYAKAIELDRSNLQAWYKKGVTFMREQSYDKALECFEQVLKTDNEYIDQEVISGLLFNAQYDKIIELSDRYPEVDEALDLLLGPEDKLREKPIIEKLKKLLNSNKLVPPLLFAKVSALATLKNDVTQMIQLHKVFATLSGQKVPRKILAILLHLSGRYEEVIELFKDTTSIEDADEFGFLAHSLESLGRYEAMMELYENEKNSLRERGLKSGDTKDLYREGIVRSSLGEYDEAIKCFNEKLLSKPGDFEALTAKGIALSKQGKYEEAIIVFNEVLNERALNLDALEHRGLCLDYLGKYDEAIKDYDMILRHLPRPLTLMNKGDSLFNLGRHEEAIKCYEKALAFTQRNPKALVGIGQCLNAAERAADAIDYYDKAIDINGHFADAWINKAEACRKLRRNAEATEYYQKSVQEYDFYMKYRGRSVEALTNKGVALFRLERYQSAIKSYTEALEINAFYSKVWINNGLAFYFMKRHEDAIESYRHCIEIGSQVRQSLILQGIVLYDLEKYEEAIAVYDQVARISSESEKSLAYILRGEANQARGKYALAMEDFKMVSDARYNYRKYFNIGICHFQLGFYDDAERDYRDAINAKPEFVDAFYNLGVLYNSEGKRERALKTFETCESIDRNFQKAREARTRLQEIEQSDWYDWWFKKTGGKRFLGGLLLSITLVLVGVTAYLSLSSAFNVDFLGFNHKDITSPESSSTQSQTSESSTSIFTDTTVLVTIIILLVVVLLLPSLKKVKLGNVELDTQLEQHGSVALDPLISNIQVESAVEVSLSGVSLTLTK